MSFRRILAVVALVAVLGMIFPPVATAGAFAADGPPVREVQPDLISRILAWAENLLAQVQISFVAQEGASITGAG